MLGGDINIISFVVFIVLLNLVYHFKAFGLDIHLITNIALGIGLYHCIIYFCDALWILFRNGLD